MKIGILLGLLIGWLVLVSVVNPLGRSVQAVAPTIAVTTIVPEPAAPSPESGAAVRMNAAVEREHMAQNIDSPGEFRVKTPLESIKPSQTPVMVADVATESTKATPKNQTPPNLTPLPVPPPTAMLQVESYPPGADVLLNGDVMGVTPLHLEHVALGQYSLKLKKPQHSFIELAMNLSEDTIVDLHMHQLPPTPIVTKAVKINLSHVTEAENSLNNIPPKPLLVTKLSDNAQRAISLPKPSAVGKLSVNVPRSANKLWLEPTTKMVFVHIPGTCYAMGSSDGESDEAPVHNVCVDDFKIGQFEVTQGQWKHVMGNQNNPSRFKVDNSHPVDSVSWVEASRFIAKLNAMGGATFRLPTEAEWEYACRAGSGDDFQSGRKISPKQANYKGEATFRKRSMPVGSFAPNGFGLYDMHGNVYEWLQDWYERDMYANSRQKNPLATDDSSFLRLLRGGAWYSSANQVRCSYRFRGRPDVQNHGNGIRLVVSSL